MLSDTGFIWFEFYLCAVWSRWNVSPVAPIKVGRERNRSDLSLALSSYSDRLPIMSKANAWLKKEHMIFPPVPLDWQSILICWFTVSDQHYNHVIAKRWSERSRTHEVRATNTLSWSRLVLRLSNLADQMEFSPFKWLIVISCKHLKFILVVAYFSQLRPCPHLEQDVLSDCLSMQHLQSSASTQHLYNGKDGHSPALGQDMFTGTHLSLISSSNNWSLN